MEGNSHDDIFLEAMKKETTRAAAHESGGSLQKGVVVSVTETDVFLDLGSKSEVVVPIQEFPKKPELGEEYLVKLEKDLKDGVRMASLKAAEKFAKSEHLKDAYRDGLPVRGTIKTLVKKDDSPKGYTIDLGTEADSFLPLSHIDTSRVEKLEDYIGQTFDFTIIDAKKNNYTVSRKEYLRKTIKKVYKAFYEVHGEGDIIKGKVEEINKNFLILDAEGIKAFLHVSDFSWKYLTDLKKVVKIGDEMEVQIISIEKERDRVKVGKKQLMPDPWENIEDRFAIGDVIKAKVIRFLKEGVMVEVEDGIEAFLPTSEMSWTQKVRDPKRFLKPGSIVEVKIKSYEPEMRRMDVSLRELQENPWENAGDNYTVGRKLEGVVSSIFDFGVFVKFDDGIEGLLRTEDVDWHDSAVDLKQRFKKGDKLQVVVLAIDIHREKLRLGIKQLSDNPFKAFSMNYPKGAPVTCTVKAILDNGITVNLQDDLEGFIHISNLDKQNVDKPADVVSVGEEIQAVVKFVDIAKSKIELSRKDFLYKAEKLEVEQYIVSDSENGSHSMTMGSMLKDQLAAIQIDSKKAKSEGSGEEKKTKSKASSKKKTKEEPEEE